MSKTVLCWLAGVLRGSGDALERASTLSFREFLSSLVYSDPRTLEFTGGLKAFVWGAWLFSPFWETFTSSPSFRAMASVASEWLWGIIIMLFGAVQVFALYRGSFKPRRVISFILCMTWTFIAAMFCIAAWRTTAAPVYAMFAIWQGWVTIRVGLYVTGDRGGL